MNNIFLSSMLIFSSILLCNIVFYGFKNAKIPGVKAFSFLILAMIIHSAGYAFELLSRSLEYMYFWVKFEYIGISFYSFLILWFISELIDEKKFANKTLLRLIFTINIVTLILVYTNAYHNLYYTSLSIDNSLGFSVLASQKGTWYFVQVISIYVSIFYSIIVCALKLKKTKGEYIKKLTFVIIGFLVPMITLSIYFIGLGPAYIDLTPFSYMFMIILIMIGLTQYDVLSITPITYEMVFNSIREAVIVVNSLGMIISFNDASKEFFPSLKNMKTGDMISSIVEISDCSFELEEFIYETNNRILKFNINLVRSREVKVFVINDITESENTKKELEIMASYDLLTGLYNRTYFNQIIENGLNNGVFVVMDIDFFKNINDTLGHIEGDNVLSHFGKKIKRFFKDDVAFRYGGEEFVVFVENKDLKEVYNHVEDLRKDIQDFPYKTKFTFSAGLATYCGGNALDSLDKADKKLYEAKSLGRNNVQY